MIRVFLLDDHEVVRRGVADLLTAEGDIEMVGESGSAGEATRRIPALRPHVAVLDARLPDGSGIDVCREMRSVDPTIQGLILTSYARAASSDPPLQRHCPLQNGAGGFGLPDGELAAMRGRPAP